MVKMSSRDMFLFVVLVGTFLVLGIYFYVRFLPFSVPTIYMRDGDNLAKGKELDLVTCSPPVNVNLSVASKLSNSTDFPPVSYHTNYKRDKFTVVMPTFGRSLQLSEILGHYCKVANVDKILVLWNNVGQEIPAPLKDFKCNVPVKFMIMKENKLTSRFVPYPDIETEAIFAVDDDRMVDRHAMEKGFAVWQAFPYLIVGFCERSHSIKKNGRYKYSGGPSYSMVLTNSVFLHRKYLDMFTNSLPSEFLTFIDKNMNGEDIIMNAMVADYLKRIDRPQCPCLLVKGSTREIHLKPAKRGQYVSLYLRGNHMVNRDKCLNLIASTYKYMPLMFCKFSIA